MRVTLIHSFRLFLETLFELFKRNAVEKLRKERYFRANYHGEQGRKRNWKEEREEEEGGTNGDF